MTGRDTGTFRLTKEQRELMNRLVAAGGRPASHSHFPPPLAGAEPITL